MSNEQLSYILALAANLSFASASVVFSLFIHKTSSLWVNTFKASLTFIILILTMPLWLNNPTIQWQQFLALFTSGFIGLAIADLFLLKAFSLIGPSRTLILFGFQPVILAISSYFLFNQPITAHHFISIMLLITCLILFGIESFKQKGKWDNKGLYLAFAAIIIDLIGILLTRYGLNEKEAEPTLGHFIRTFGAIIGLIILNKLFPTKFLTTFKNLTFKEKVLICITAFFGTYLSLLFYLNAIKIGHLASISAIAITGPIFATIIEGIYHQKPPSKYQIICLIIFIIGFLNLFF